MTPDTMPDLPAEAWSTKPLSALSATPVLGLDLAVDPAEFNVEIRSRLCMQGCAVDQWCLLRDAVLDSRGHHSRMCCAGGDRTRRRNGLRNRISEGPL